MLRSLLSAFSLADLIPLGIGLVLGVAILLLIRSGQVWRFRAAYGYSVYAADQARRRLIAWGLAILAGGTITIGAYFLLRAVLRDRPVPTASSEDLDESFGPQQMQDMALVIPRLGVETTFVEAGFIADQWDISRLSGEVAHLAGTAYPGQPGNVVLAGHITIPVEDTPGPFYELESLQIGDKVYIVYGRTTFSYEVFRSLHVAPSSVEVAFPTDDNRLTLITCSGWDGSLDSYTQRLVIIARLIS